MIVGDGVFEGPYSFSSRFEQGSGTNPEELIGAAHAGCFSQAFALMLGDEGFTPEKISTAAEVSLEKKGEGFEITGIDLTEIPLLQRPRWRKTYPVLRVLRTRSA